MSSGFIRFSLAYDALRTDGLANPAASAHKAFLLQNPALFRIQSGFKTYPLERSSGHTLKSSLRIAIMQQSQVILGLVQQVHLYLGMQMGTK